MNEIDNGNLNGFWIFVLLLFWVIAAPITWVYFNIFRKNE